MFSEILHNLMNLVKENKPGKVIISLKEFQNYSKGDIMYIAKAILETNFSDYFWKLGCNLNSDCTEVVYSYNPDAVKPSWID